MNRACAKLDYKEDHDTNGSEHPEGLDDKEVASIEHLPVAPNELLPPCTRANPLWRRLDPNLGQDVRHCRTTDFDLQSAKRVSDLGVAPFEVLPR